MAKLFITCFVLLCLSSCIKVEDISLCPNKPAIPRLTSSTVTVPASSNYFRPAIISPDAATQYYWIGPFGTLVTGDTTGLPTMYGRWGVYEQRTSCNSDTFYFNVTPAPCNCSIGHNMLQVSPQPAQALTILQTSNSPYNGYYLVQMQNTAGSVLYMRFRTYPTNGAYLIVDDVYGSYNTNSPIVEVRWNNQYTGSGGYAYITVSGTIINITFCNTKFYNPDDGNYYSINANVAGS